MVAKAEAKDPAPAPAEKPASAPDKAAAEAKSSSGGKKVALAAVAAVVLAPALSVAVAQFVLLPRLEKKLSAADAAAPAAETASAPAHPGDPKDKSAPPAYEFTNMVVNLAGTMGTRYLKTSFMVTGTDATLQTQFESNKARMTDVTLNVLSALTLADLEEPGSKNVLREKLVGAYNDAFGHKVADQVYFSDFVIQ